MLRDAGLDAAEYPASVAKTLLLLIRQLGREHPAATRLLWLCAFLDPGDIDLDLLSAGKAVTGEALARVLGGPSERARRHAPWRQRTWSPSRPTATCGFGRSSKPWSVTNSAATRPQSGSGGRWT